MNGKQSKKLYMIGGTMGVGKSTVCRFLKTILPDCVFLDGDWCWDSNPFVVTAETKKIVIDNICHILNNFLNCSAYKNIVFCWVMHDQSIIDNILANLNLNGAEVKCISLTADKDAIKKRLENDISAGIRKADIIERSLERLPLYDRLDTIKINTDNKTAEEISQKISAL